LKKGRQRSRKKKVARPVLSRIVEANVGGEDEEDNGRLCELNDLAEANYYTQKQQEEDAFLSRVTDDLEADYFRQKAAEAKEAETSNRNVVLQDDDEDWDEDDELLSKGGSD
jgi:hypothetical protein